jgi:hypothetical protein
VTPSKINRIDIPIIPTAVLKSPVLGNSVGTAVGCGSVVAVGITGGV